MVGAMTPEDLAADIRRALSADYPTSLSPTGRAWIDAMYQAHGELYSSRLEHSFTEEFLRRCGLTDEEIFEALGALHP
jgi:hypothetical protein